MRLMGVGCGLSMNTGSYAGKGSTGANQVGGDGHEERWCTGWGKKDEIKLTAKTEKNGAYILADGEKKKMEMEFATGGLCHLRQRDSWEERAERADGLISVSYTFRF